MDKIFGTPEEPIFNEKTNGISPEILLEWLIALALLNSQNVDSDNVCLGLQNCCYSIYIKRKKILSSCLIISCNDRSYVLYDQSKYETLKSVLASSALDCRFESRSGQIQTIT
jgi:hypothetical protein